jgi:phosphoglycerate dehydrogenase-like enzyme
MSFKILLLPDANEEWADLVREAVPGVDVQVFSDPAAAMEEIEDADAVYGTVPPELLRRARKLRWIAASRAGLGGRWFYPELVDSDVVVTNVRGIYNEHLSHHIMGFLLAFARRFDHYFKRNEAAPEWRRDLVPIDLPSSTAVVVGVGGSGAEAGRLCAEFGMRVIGVDPRTAEAPAGFSALLPPDRIDEALGQADFVILTVPESPATMGFMNKDRFAATKRGAYFINIGRGVTTNTDDLVAALQSGQLAGAGLDVVNPEPLPSDHPLWSIPGVLITPHIGVTGDRENSHARRVELLIENCRRFARGEQLMNVVDKKAWF